MTTNFTAIESQLGKGIYSIPDAAIILDMPLNKVHRWVNKYWELEFIQNGGFDSSYTWGEKRERESLSFFNTDRDYRSRFLSGNWSELSKN